MNDTKDKVRYLESLKRHLDQLYHGATPATILNTALPGLIQTVKQMESVSRYYARQGFLGLLFTKVRKTFLFNVVHMITIYFDSNFNIYRCLNN